MSCNAIKSGPGVGVCLVGWAGVGRERRSRILSCCVVAPEEEFYSVELAVSYCQYTNNPRVKLNKERNALKY